MILSPEEVKKVLFGAVSVAAEDGVIAPEKCTKKQQDAWMAKSENWGKGSRKTTGIRLDFHTDSSIFAVTLSHGNKFSLLINGEKAEHWFPMNTETRCERELPEGENRITLIFPSHSVGRIKDVELSDGATVKPHIFDRKILMLGDSITQGWDSQWDVNSYAWRVALSLNAECVINGIGGTRFFPDTVDEIPFDPDLITVAYGTNDYSRDTSMAQFEKACRGTLQRLKELYPAKPIAVILPIWRADEEPDRGVGSFEDLQEKMREIVRDLGLFLVEGDDLVPHDPALYADERLHPNDEGFRYYAENLLQKLKALL